MNRVARLQSAKHWLPTYTGRDLVKGYRNWYGMSSICAIIELRQLGIKVDEQRWLQAKRTEESKMQHRVRKKQQTEKRAAEEAVFVESDENCACIAAHRKWGVSSGGDEIEAESEPF